MSAVAPALWSQRRLGPEARAALALAGLWLAWTLSSLVLRQGLAAAWDEVELHSRLQLAREGAVLPQGLGQHTLGIRALASLLWFPGFQPGWLHAPIWLGLGLEGALLWHLARRLGGSPLQALGAVAAQFAGRLTWLRAGSLHSFSLAPLWVLSAWTLALGARGWAQGLAAGLAGGLLLGDYEGCLAAGPGLAWLCWRRARAGESGAWACLAGLGLGVGLLLLLLPSGYFQHYAAVRGQSLAVQGLPWWRELGQNLAAFFLGLGKPLQDLGLGAAFSLAALPWVLRGLRRLPTEAWFFLLGGLGLLAAPAPLHTEAHRAVTAWAPLCLAAGLGLPQGRRAALAALGLLAAFTLWDGARFSAQRAALEPQRYEYSWRLERAARHLRGQAVLSELNFRSLGAFRLRHASPPPDGMLPAWALLSGEQTGPRPPAAWGAWHPIQMSPEGGTLWLVQLWPAQQAPWSLHERFVRGMLQELAPLGWMDQLRVIERHLRLPGFNAFEKGFLLDRALWAAKDVGLPAGLAMACADEPWLSARHCLALATALSGVDRGRAIALVERALQLDPQRPGARRYLADLKAGM